MATGGKLAVVVAQYGADVSACVARDAGEGAVEVVQQAADESGAQLTTRVREHLSRLVSAGYRVHSASFIARGGFDVRDVMATAGLLRGLVASMVAVGAGQVHIRAAAGDEHTRYALTALADALSEQLHGTGVKFHTDFAGAQAETDIANGQPVQTEPARRRTTAPAR